MLGLEDLLGSQEQASINDAEVRPPSVEVSDSAPKIRPPVMQEEVVSEAD